MPFVNRFAERHRMDFLAADVQRELTERHLALVGPRRIGKSRLLTDYRDRAAATGAVATVEIAVDSAASTLPTFLLEMVRGVTAGFLRHASHRPLPEAPTEAQMAAAAAAVAPGLGELVVDALRLRNTARPDGHQLFTTAIRLPEAAAHATGTPVVVLADEFQHIVDLATYPPFRAGRGPIGKSDQGRILAALRPAIERREHVGWIVTGSSIRLMMEVLGSGPLMGRFDLIEVAAFDSADARRLARAVWEDLGVDYADEAADRVDVLASGHPFYVDVVCRAAAGMAARLDSAVTPDLIDRSLLESVSTATGSISIACQETWDSIVARIPALRGLVLELAQHRDASVLDLAREIGLPHESNTWGYVRELERIGVVQRAGTRVSLVDPVFGFWLVRSQDPEAPADLVNEARVSRAIKRFEERWLADRADRGLVVEGYVRDLIRTFGGQVIDGKRLGITGSIALPDGSNVRRIMADDAGGEVFGYPSSVELDACFGTDEVWLCEVKDRSRKSDAADIDRLVRKDAFLRRTLGLPGGRSWFVSFGGFTKAARERAAANGVLLSRREDLDSIASVVATRRA